MSCEPESILRGRRGTRRRQHAGACHDSSLRSLEAAWVDGCLLPEVRTQGQVCDPAAAASLGYCRNGRRDACEASSNAAGAIKRRGVRSSTHRQPMRASATGTTNSLRPPREVSLVQFNLYGDGGSGCESFDHPTDRFGQPGTRAMCQTRSPSDTICVGCITLQQGGQVARCLGAGLAEFQSSHNWFRD